MIVVTGTEQTHLEQAARVCREHFCEARTVQIVTGDSLPDLRDADAVLVVDPELTPELLALVGQLVRTSIPTAVLAHSLFSDRVTGFLRTGLAWLATYDGEPSVVAALDRLGVVPGCSDELHWSGDTVLRPQRVEHFRDIITDDPFMRSVLAHAELASANRQTVLITGETGTGKDLVAQAIHRSSGLTGRYVAENVSGLDDTLFSDALFGHIKGSYTGATATRQGLVRSAEGGTLFLDEIGDLSLASQTKLLRLLENREFYPIGADRPVPTTARFVVATHQDLPRRVREGAFRRDLYFRLRVHELHLPPLHRRAVDLEPLARHFAEQAAAEQRRPAPELSEGFLAALHAYSFPGNVRELRSALYRAVTLSSSGVLTARDFMPALFPLTPPAVPAAVAPAGTDDRVVFPRDLPTMDRVIECLIDEALERADGNQSAAARLIGLSPSAINKRLRSRIL